MPLLVPLTQIVDLPAPLRVRAMVMHGLATGSWQNQQMRGFLQHLGTFTKAYFYCGFHELIWAGPHCKELLKEPK